MPQAGHPAQLRDRAAADDRDGDTLAARRERF
jgi:hypothetical protein